MITCIICIVIILCAQIYYVVKCPSPTNGVLYCMGGYKTIATLGNSCIFSCIPGYRLEGSSFGTCLSDQSWSGGVRSCIPLNCSSNISTMNDNVSLTNLPCSLEYRSQCVLPCTEGLNITYICNVTHDDTITVNWVPVGGSHLSCDNGKSIT